jgi:hypothetical protein
MNIFLENAIHSCDKSFLYVHRFADEMGEYDKKQQAKAAAKDSAGEEKTECKSDVEVSEAKQTPKKKPKGENDIENIFAKQYKKKVPKILPTPSPSEVVINSDSESEAPLSSIKVQEVTDNDDVSVTANDVYDA